MEHLRTRAAIALVMLTGVLLAARPLEAQCKRCQKDGVPCPAAGNVACTSDLDPGQFGTTECSQVPGCGGETSSDAGATCGAGAFAGCGPLGACCRPDGSCAQATQNLCEVDGSYAGDGTVCGTFECPTVGGACCSRFSGSCAAKTEAFCEAFGSFGGDYYLGDGTVCADGVCGCCTCTCDDGPVCVQPLAIGGCVTACAAATCGFQAGATGRLCYGAACVQALPATAPTASATGLLAMGGLVLAIGYAALRRRRGRSA